MKVRRRQLDEGGEQVVVWPWPIPADDTKIVVAKKALPRGDAGNCRKEHQCGRRRDRLHVDLWRVKSEPAWSLRSGDVGEFELVATTKCSRGCGGCVAEGDHDLRGREASGNA